MALVNWNPVTAANFSESNALRLAAQQQLAGGIKGIGDTAVAFNDATGKANTDILLNSLVGQRTPEAAAAAIEAAKAQAGGMYNNYDQAAFRSAAEALPKAAADAQELDLQIADKPFIQAAALAFSKKDPAAVAHFANQVKSRDGIAQITGMISGAQTMAVQDAGVLNAEGKLAEEIRSAKVDEGQARYNGLTQRIEATKKSSTGSETAKNTFLNMVASVRQKFKTAADKAGTEALIGSQDTVEAKAALQNTINGKDGKGLDSWGNATGKNIHDVLMATVPGYAGTGAKNQKAVIDYLLAKNTTQTGGGLWDSMVNRDLTDEQITTLGATALGEVTANASTNLARTQELGIQDGVAQLRLEAEKLGIQATDAELREMLFPSAIPQPKPKEDPKAAEQYLKDKAELAAREAKRQADLAAGKGNPTSAADTLLNVGKSVKAGINSIPSVIKTGFNAVVPVKYQKPPEDPEAAKAYASIEAKLKAAETRRYTDALFAEIKADEAAKVKLKSQLSKSVVPSTQTKTGTWETMFKQVADKANEVISGKGWSNDPKNQEQYENGLIVGGETTQPSSKHEIDIYGMWDKDDNVKSQFLGDYDTFKGYAVKVKVKGGEEYGIPITYDEIAAHTGANIEDIRSASTMDIRNNAVVRRRVYRTALDKLNTHLNKSKDK